MTRLQRRLHRWIWSVAALTMAATVAAAVYVKADLAARERAAPQQAVR